MFISHNIGSSLTADTHISPTKNCLDLLKSAFPHGTRNQFCSRVKFMKLIPERIFSKKPQNIRAKERTYRHFSRSWIRHVFLRQANRHIPSRSVADNRKSLPSYLRIFIDSFGQSNILKRKTVMFGQTILIFYWFHGRCDNKVSAVVRR